METVCGVCVSLSLANLYIVHKINNYNDIFTTCQQEAYVIGIYFEVYYILEIVKLTIISRID